MVHLLSKAAIAVALAVLVLLSLNSQAEGQPAICPAGTAWMGEIDGTYPGGTSFCRLSSATNTVPATDFNNNYPCGEYVRMYYPISNLGIPQHYVFYIVPPENYPLDNLVNLRAYYIPGWFVGGEDGWDGWGVIPWVPPPNITYQVFNGDGTIIMERQRNVSEYNTYPGQSSTGNIYNTYYIDETFDTGGMGGMSGGYIRVHIFAAARGRWTSTRLGNPTTPGDMCAIPGGLGPVTPTPWPTPTGEAPPPTPTLWATSPPSDPFPTATLAPIVFPTIPAEPTPTPWPIYQIPPVTWPSVPMPPTAVVTVDAGNGGGDPPSIPTIQSAVVDTDQLEDLLYTIQSDWAILTSGAITATDTTITGTTGIAAPSETVASILQYIVLPIAYIRSIPIYAPNIGIYTNILFGIVLMMLFVKLVEPVIRATMFVFEIIRKIWGMIPFT